ncbi:MAG: SMP-30/gluconolactonase/LRE family protein [Pirellulales bacterium]
MTRLIPLLSLFVLFTACLVNAQDMPLHYVLIDGEGWQLVSEGHKFTEGPAVDAEGNLYFVDVPGDTIFKHDVESGKTSIFLQGAGKCSGLMFGPDGRLYASQNANNKVIAIDAKKGIEVIAEGLGANDLMIDRKGGIYSTDPKNHQVWYVAPSGEKRVVAKDIETPNGIILWGDQSTLVVADTRGKHLWVFRVEIDGSLTQRSPIYTCRLPLGQTASGADGMTVDTQGRLYVATALGVQMFDSQCRISGVILKPQQATLSNVVFAGKNLDVMFVTTADKVYRRKTKATGLRYTSKK